MSSGSVKQDPLETSDRGAALVMVMAVGMVLSMLMAILVVGFARTSAPKAAVPAQ